MKYRRRIYYSAVQRAEIWDRWQRGESMSSIGRAFERESSSVFSVISPTGGIRPPDRKRGAMALNLAEREEISRGLPRIHEFWKSNPDIQVSMMPSLEAVDIPAMGFDLAIRATIDAPDWSGLDAEFLCDSQLIVVAAPSLIGTKLSDIAEMPWIFTRGTVYEEKRLRSIGLDSDLLRNVQLGSMSYEISAEIQGLGLAITPKILVRDELARDRLREVPVTGLRKLSYYAVTPKGPVRPQAIKFIDWLKQIFAD